VKTVVVVQARMGSSRLPGKVLMPVADAPLLERMLERLRAASTPTEIVVATTTDPSDEPIVALCRRTGTRFFRGHPTDLLDRHFAAANAAQADAVVKIPSDCPLIDPDAVDRVIGTFLASAGEYDFVSNLHPGTWPDGNDVEIFTMEALEIAHREADRPHEREHTTPFVWDRPDRFRLGNVLWEGETGRDLSMTHRLTIDYPEDYELIRSVYDALWTAARPVFSLSDVLEFLETHPRVRRINERYNGVNWYRHHLAELRTISKCMTRSPA
jgi:spore coat polysaccharide biosynthesis protein SpsF